MATAKQKSVWVIEQGEYSDYRVVGVYTEKAGAELVAAAINAERQFNPDATVMEWPLNPALDDLNAGRRPWIVDMRYDGTVERCDPWEVSGYQLAGDVHVWPRSAASAYAGTGVEDCIHATVWASDGKHAVKIVNEKRAQMIESGEFRAPVKA